MAVRSTFILLAAAGLVTSVSAVALGLGELRLQSTINQPLSAEIELLSVAGHEAGQLRARLGSAEDFARAGIERSHALMGMVFRPVLDATGGPVLKVTSNQSVREPYLDFVVRLEWPDGQLLRAYTVLLDLPERSVQPPLARRSGPATFDTGAAASDSSGTAQRSTGFSPLRRPAIVPGSGTYTVRSGDTLWNVANRARPQGATVQQTLMAIYRENPDAFIDGDMNRMRRDYPLRVPEPSAVAAIDANEARAVVWREAGDGLRAAPRVNDFTAESPSTSDRVAAGQLRLAPPRLDASPAGTPAGDGSATHPDSSAPGGGTSHATVDRERATSTGGSRDTEADIEAATNNSITPADAAAKIMYLEEEVLLTRRENRELHERIDNLEEQLGVMSRLVELQGDTAAVNELPQPEPAPELLSVSRDKPPVADASVAAPTTLLGKGWPALVGLAALLLGGLAVRKRRRQRHEELVAPGLFMTHDAAAASNHDSALEVSEEPAAYEEPAAGKTPSAYEEPSEERKPLKLREEEGARSIAAVPHFMSAESREISSELRVAQSSQREITASSSDAAPDAELDLELDLPTLENEPRSWVSNSGSAEAHHDASALVTLDPERPNIEEESLTADELSLEQWFAELAEESPNGQNEGADLPVLDESDPTGLTVSAAGAPAASFDLDFASFGDEADALAQRDPVQTRLELARVYIDMQDAQSAKEILEELLAAADQEVQRDARELLYSLE